jgi:hypothetical protein
MNDETNLSGSIDAKLECGNTNCHCCSLDIFAAVQFWVRLHFFQQSQTPLGILIHGGLLPFLFQIASSSTSSGVSFSCIPRPPNPKDRNSSVSSLPRGSRCLVGYSSSTYCLHSETISDRLFCNAPALAKSRRNPNPCNISPGTRRPGVEHWG